MTSINTSIANSQYHWPCGTPRSHGNAFDLAPRPVAAAKPKRVRAPEATSDARREQKRAAQRAYSQTEAGKANKLASKQREKLKAAALRVNREDFCISQTPQEDRDKTNKLLGRSFQGRTA